MKTDNTNEYLIGADVYAHPWFLDTAEWSYRDGKRGF